MSDLAVMMRTSVHLPCSTFIPYHKTAKATIMIRSSKAIWKGSGKEGGGLLTSTSGVLKDTPYSFTTRFVSEDGKAGTNPEELIAAAHAGCFTMKLSFG